MRKFLGFLLPLFVTVEVAASTQNLVTTVILVRHAEKGVVSQMADDVPLSDAGMARAHELSRALADVHVDAIYTTQYLRTRQTAMPLAKAQNIKAVAIEAGKTYAEDIAKRIRADHEGQTVVVVGHSNTTPEVIRALGVATVPAIGETEYDDLFIVTLAPGATPKLITLRYGAPAR